MAKRQHATNAVNALQLGATRELEHCWHARIVEFLVRMMMRIGRAVAGDLVLQDLNPCCFNILPKLVPGAGTRTVAPTAAGPASPGIEAINPSTIRHVSHSERRRVAASARSQSTGPYPQPWIRPCCALG
jgi:hypothetical protein